MSLFVMVYNWFRHFGYRCSKEDIDKVVRAWNSEYPEYKTPKYICRVCYREWGSGKVCPSRPLPPPPLKVSAPKPTIDIKPMDRVSEGMQQPPIE